MNFEHLKALLAVRFQLTKNQIQRSGKLNLVIVSIFVVMGLISSIASFFVALIGGAIWLSWGNADHVLIAWNILTVIFIFGWMIGILSELQRTELMSLEKLLHLPISLRSAFFLNYTSSFINFSFLLFVPLMIGLILGSAIAMGPKMLVGIPLLICFLFMVTTVTYQFRGWLGRLMQNKRRRGTIVVAATMGFVLITLIPTMVNMSFQGKRTNRISIQETQLAEFRANRLSELEADFDSPIVNEQAIKIRDQVDKEVVKKRERMRSDRFNQTYQSIVQYLKIGDLAIPLGWLALSTGFAADGRVIPAALSSLGMAAIGLLSLSLSFRSTMRDFFSSGSRVPTNGLARQKLQKSRVKSLMSASLPGLSSQSSAITIGAFKSLMRAPESKLSLLVPIIVCAVFIPMIATSTTKVPEFVEPMLALGFIAAVMFGFMSTLSNQFGSDRDGFKSYVLMPVSRKEILLGKNLAFIPLVFTTIIGLLVFGQIFVPLRITHFLATLVQVPICFLLYCLLGNVVSIFCPLGIARGTMQPIKYNYVTMLVVASSMMLSPLLVLPGLAICSVEALLEYAFNRSFAPLYLVLSFIELIGVILLYRRAINVQGSWLKKRETRVLEIVCDVE